MQLLDYDTKKKYAVLEFGEETLHDHLKKYVLSDNERKVIVEQLVQGLHEIHAEKKLIHGDIKPLNVMHFGRYLLNTNFPMVSKLTLVLH